MTGAGEGGRDGAVFVFVYSVIFETSHEMIHDTTWIAHAHGHGSWTCMFIETSHISIRVSPDTSSHETDQWTDLRHL